MSLLQVIEQRHAPSPAAQATPGLGGSPREQLLRRITARRGGH
ncbi:MAG TPA: hypothetical protein VFG87_15200 [Amycolatopsis sp.]|nr:hypothetical protein [Amycolatopsis sp.]